MFSYGRSPGRKSKTKIEELHRELISELCSSGAIEDDAVANIARLMWRKKIFKLSSTAELAQERYSEILTENADSPILGDPGNLAKCEEQMRFANDLAQKELGGIYELVKALVRRRRLMASRKHWTSKNV